MSFWDSLFGGGGYDANKNQNKRGREFVKEQLAQTRGDIFGNFPLAQDARRQGTQSAMDLFGDSAQARIDPLIQGNMNAQSSLLAGLPQIRNAILGGHVNMNYASPQGVDYDTSWMNQTLPEPGRVQAFDGQTGMPQQGSGQQGFEQQGGIDPRILAHLMGGLQ